MIIMTPLTIPRYSPIPNAFCGLSTCLYCKGVCTPAEWKCASGECLPENQRCDGITQCSDGSDEDRCGNYMTAFARNSQKWPSHCTCSLASRTLQNFYRFTSCKKNISVPFIHDLLGSSNDYILIRIIIYPIR